LADLPKVMGISRSSFHAAFTDKRVFFTECLDLWATRTLELLKDQRSGLPLIDALQKVFERSFVDVQCSKFNWGCMLVNNGIRVFCRRRLPEARYLQSIAATIFLVRSAIA
jgi:hypothetical protein